MWVYSAVVKFNDLGFVRYGGSALSASFFFFFFMFFFLSRVSFFVFLVLFVVFLFICLVSLPISVFVVLSMVRRFAAQPLSFCFYLICDLFLFTFFLPLLFGGSFFSVFFVKEFFGWTLSGAVFTVFLCYFRCASGLPQDEDLCLSNRWDYSFASFPSTLTDDSPLLK